MILPNIRLKTAVRGPCIVAAIDTREPPFGSDSIE
jgi:hypothetical protein